jgi:archaellum biogenesis protein FlaJ (TadC family)
MDALAEDAREIMRISRERVSRTTMPVMFLYTLTLFIAPFIFGFTLTVVSFICSGMQLAGGDGSPASDPILNLVLMLSMAPLNRPLFELKTSALGFVLVNFLCLQAVISTFAIGIIREGKYLKYLLRAPFMILISMIFYISGLTLAAMIVK